MLPCVCASWLSAYARAHKHTHTHEHTHACPHPPTRPRTHTRARAHINMHEHTCARTRIHSHAFTNTHPRACYVQFSPLLMLLCIIERRNFRSTCANSSPGDAQSARSSTHTCMPLSYFLVSNAKSLKNALRSCIKYWSCPHYTIHHD